VDLFAPFKRESLSIEGHHPAKVAQFAGKKKSLALPENSVTPHQEMHRCRQQVR
jgi:hypothetical protein